MQFQKNQRMFLFFSIEAVMFLFFFSIEARHVLSMFLIFKKFEPQRSYKHGSYSRESVQQIKTARARFDRNRFVPFLIKPLKTGRAEEKHGEASDQRALPQSMDNTSIRQASELPLGGKKVCDGTC